MTIDIAYKHTKCFGYNRDHTDNTKSERWEHKICGLIIIELEILRIIISLSNWYQSLNMLLLLQYCSEAQNGNNANVVNVSCVCLIPHGFLPW